MERAALTALLVLCVPCFLGCDSGTPVAPASAVLTVTATPQEIALNGTSAVTVVATRSNGIPVNKDTEIRLTTTLGTIDEVVTTDSSGVARGTLTAGTRSGTATITASSGGAAPATFDVTIGFAPGGITLLASPSSVSETGGSVELRAIVRDELGEPLGDAAVNFLTELGTLDSGGAVIRTNENGEAVDRLRFSQQDADLTAADDFEVTAEVGGAGGTQTATTQITIRRLPEADFSFRPVGLRVEFTDTSTGNPTAWDWNFGDGATSGVQNPVHDYASPGTYTVRLEARNNEGSDVREKLVTVN